MVPFYNYVNSSGDQILQPVLSVPKIVYLGKPSNKYVCKVIEVRITEEFFTLGDGGLECSNKLSKGPESWRPISAGRTGVGINITEFYRSLIRKVIDVNLLCYNLIWLSPV